MDEQTASCPYPELIRSGPRLPFYILGIHFNIILLSTLRPSMGLFPRGFTTTTLYAPFLLTTRPHALAIPFFLLCSLENCTVGSTDHQAPHYAVSSSPLSSCPGRPYKFWYKGKVHAITANWGALGGDEWSASCPARFVPGKGPPPMKQEGIRTLRILVTDTLLEGFTWPSIYFLTWKYRMVYHTNI
jgi:hypothetical protein